MAWRLLLARRIHTHTHTPSELKTAQNIFSCCIELIRMCSVCLLSVVWKLRESHSITHWQFSRRHSQSAAATARIPLNMYSKPTSQRKQCRDHSRMWMKAGAWIWECKDASRAHTHIHARKHNFYAFSKSCQWMGSCAPLYSIDGIHVVVVSIALFPNVPRAPIRILVAIHTVSSRASSSSSS